MEFKAVTATQKLLKLDRRIKAAAGGTSASKTISILLILIDKCQVAANKNQQLLVSVVSESLPHLKRGAMRDFINIMEGHGYFKEASWNRTDFTYFFSPTVKMEFFGVDSPDKVRGPRRQILFMNEANNCSWHSFEQLEVRTEQEIWLDWNPTNEFWFYKHVLENRAEDLDFVTLTYKDNEALPESIVKSIEARKYNKGWWKVYGLGQLGEVEGKIYRDWQIIDKVPHEARLERLGLDFGFSNDPAVLVAIYYYNGGYIVDELLYKTNLSNRKVADYITSSGLDNALVVADTAEPKSISEMLEYGIQVIGSQRGTDRKLQGIQYVQDQRMSITKKSANVIDEYRNYMWRYDKDGEIMSPPKPEHQFSHSMDACLVAGTQVLTDRGEKPIEKIGVGDKVLTREGYKKVLSAGLTGKDKQVYELNYGLYKLVGTGNHPIWTEDGWKDLRDIRYADKLLTWRQLLNIEGENFTVIQTPSNSIVGDIFTTLRDFCTGISIRTISEKYRKVCTSITKITTTPITAQKIWNFLRTQNTAKNIGKRNNQLLKNVLLVPVNSATLTTVRQTGFAPINVSLSGDVPKGLITRYEGALTVTKYSPPTDSKTRRLVREAAQTVKELKTRADVYNLEVEDAHEYFANGVLVHNCRYAMESLRPSEDEKKTYVSGQLTKLWG